jgi:hypothetical protein
VRSDIHHRWEVIGREYNTFYRAELSCGDNGGCTYTIFTKAKKLGKDQTGKKYRINLALKECSIDTGKARISLISI